MTTKDQLHELVDQLPDEETDRAAQLLQELTDPVLRALRNAPSDDEPQTDAERQAVEEGWEDYRAGRVISMDDIRREFGGR